MNDTATSIRHEQMQKQRAYQLLSEHPELQAESIATNYVAYASLARNILQTIRNKREFKIPMHEIDEIVERMVNTIKVGHGNDLGIELEWEAKK